MRIPSPIHRRHARIEIIPLIDIMFFLLASFMLVSLSMTKVKNIRVDLPVVPHAQSDFGADMIHIAVDKAGDVWVEKHKIGLPELYTTLTNRYAHNTRVPVFIGGDADTLHGEMIKVLEVVRQAGIQKVAFSVGEGGIGRP